VFVAVKKPASRRVVEDDPERVTASGAQPANPVAQIDAISALCALNGPVMHGENHSIPLPQRHNFRARLHARALLGEHKLAAGEIRARVRQQDRDLKRERQFAVEVLGRQL